MPRDSVADAVEWYRRNVDPRHSPTPFSGPDVTPGENKTARKVKQVIAEAYDIAAARAKREHHEANMAEMRECQLSGSLVDKSEVEKRLDTAAAQIRMALERIPDKIADRLAAESDAHVCHGLITAEIDQVLDDLAQVRIA
jgi:phage terminase Nu1 subunit (DNA packaging protein)